MSSLKFTILPPPAMLQQDVECIRIGEHSDEEGAVINGGFYKKTTPDQNIKLTILVKDIREAMQKIEAAGGKVLGEPFELPGVGLFVTFMDTEGNVATINQDFTIKQL